MQNIREFGTRKKLPQMKVLLLVTPNPRAKLAKNIRYGLREWKNQYSIN